MSCADAASVRLHMAAVIVGLAPAYFESRPRLLEYFSIDERAAGLVSIVPRDRLDELERLLARRVQWT